MAKKQVNEYSRGQFGEQFYIIREKQLGRILKKALKSGKTFNPLVCGKPNARHFKDTK